MFYVSETSTEDEDYINMLEDRYKELKDENDALKERIEELEAAMTKIRDLAVPTTEGRTKSKRERLTLIVNTVDAALKGTGDD